MSKWWKVEVERVQKEVVYVLTDDDADWLDASEKAEIMAENKHGGSWHGVDEREVPYGDVPKNLRT